MLSSDGGHLFLNHTSGVCMEFLRAPRVPARPSSCAGTRVWAGGMRLKVLAVGVAGCGVLAHPLFQSTVGRSLGHVTV